MSILILVMAVPFGFVLSGCDGNVNQDPPIWTVMFVSMGGSAVTSQSINDNGTAVQPTAPIRDDHTFSGWFTSETGGTQFSFTTRITEHTILFARWEFYFPTIPGETGQGNPAPQLPTGARMLYVGVNNYFDASSVGPHSGPGVPPNGNTWAYFVAPQTGTVTIFFERTGNVALARKTIVNGIFSGAFTTTNVPNTVRIWNMQQENTHAIVQVQEGQVLSINMLGSHSFGSWHTTGILRINWVD